MPHLNSTLSSDDTFRQENRTMSDSTIPSLTLNDGTTLPSVGFGTYKLKGSTGVESIVQAIESGYRLLDSAVNYENEGALGNPSDAAQLPERSYVSRPNYRDGTISMMTR